MLNLFEQFFGFGSISLAPSDMISGIRNSFFDFTEQPLDVLILWFFMFSFVGYCLECVVLSIENHKKITNRGFTHLPLCIIYGFCAIIASVMLSPLLPSPFLIYITSLMIATLAELITAHAMIKLFGGFWWDYSMKKFNYKGMISLETSLGWGLVGIIFFYFLSGGMFNVVYMIPEQMRVIISAGLLIVYAVDFIVCGYKRYTGQEDDTDGVGRKKVNVSEE